MDKQYMELAIKLAESTAGQTSPNPQVGCVIVKNHEIKGVGTHLRAGEHHAEIHALNMAGYAAKGATAYVTLEPCAHHGQTPPCSDALIRAGIKRVVIASTDPNPEVSGRGMERLRDAGITVESGLMKEEADYINRWFFHSITHGIPYVTLKFATSLDGKLATSSGESQWITNEESREDVHRLRHFSDAILIGSKTVIADDPSLTTRLKDGGNNPIRVILDRSFKTPPKSRIVVDRDAPTWIYTLSNAAPRRIKQFNNKGTAVYTIDEEKDFLQAVLENLAYKGVRSLLVEGGGTINDAFLNSGHFNEVIHYQAPVIIGGKDAKSAFSGMGVQTLADAPRLKLLKEEHFGDDIKRTYIR